MKRLLFHVTEAGHDRYEEVWVHEKTESGSKWTIWCEECEVQHPAVLCEDYRPVILIDQDHTKGKTMSTDNINTLAAEFVKKHGSFSLEFDAEQNYIKPDDCPWTVLVGEGAQLSDHTSVEVYAHGYAGFTAEEALAFADAELCLPPGP